MKSQTLKTLLGLAVASQLFTQANAAALFTENAGNACYDKGWTVGSSQPKNFGWFTAATVVKAPGSAGVAIGDSRNLANPGNYPDINAGGRAWRLYGIGGGGQAEADAYGFLKDGAGKDSTLSPGQTLSLDIAVNFRNGFKGFAARDAKNNEIFTFNIGSDDYVVSHAATGNGSIGDSYSDNTVFHVAVTQSKPGGGTWTITRRGGVSAKATGTYAGTVANFKLYVGQADSGNANELFANNVAVTASGSDTKPPRKSAFPRNRSSASHAWATASPMVPACPVAERIPIRRS